MNLRALIMAAVSVGACRDATSAGPATMARAGVNDERATPTHRPGRDRPHGRGGGPNIHVAIEQWAQARCENASKCGEIGVGRRYATQEACLTAATSARLRDWGGLTCAPHVNGTQLGMCLASTRMQSCHGPGGEPLLHQECHTDELCGE